METKKYPKSDLERMRSLFFNLGLIVSLTLVIMAFEWKSPYHRVMVDLYQPTDVIEVIENPQTIHKTPPPPKPVPVVNIIESEEEVEEELIEIDTEFDDEFEIPEVTIIEDVPDEPVPDYYTIVEQMPSPEGGMNAFFQFLAKNMKYPNQARRMGIEGRVFVQFMVGTDGSLSEIEVVKGIGSGCDEEAIRVMSKVPKWNPGKQRGRPVKVRMILPIHFKLQ